MTWGDRKGSRVSFERTIDTFVMGIDGTWRRNCQLVDVSATGARLIVLGSMAGLNLRPLAVPSAVASWSDWTAMRLAFAF